MKTDFLKLGAAGMCSLLLACSNPNFGLQDKQDNFSQSIAYNNKVDILWIIDDSSSMKKHQERLTAQVPALVNTLTSLKMDFHMSVITTSVNGSNPTGGKFLGNPKYVTNTTPNLVNDLTARLIPGETGNDNERGLDSMKLVLSSNYLNGEGAGFLRSDALLVIIALSDEDDKSASSVTTFTNFLDALKAPWIDGSRSWMFNFIGILEDSPACRTTSYYSQVGDVWMNMVAKTSGLAESLCASNLGAAVSNIRARIYQILTDFKLTGVPLVDTIVVKINGVIIPRNTTNGWDYLPASNSIRFYGTAVPGADASIKVDFSPAAAN